MKPGQTVDLVEVCNNTNRRVQMNQHRYRILLAIMIALVISGAPLFATGAQEGGTTSGLDAIGFHASGYPIVDEPVSVRLLVWNFPPISDFIENDFTEWYQDYTNVEVEWDLMSDDMQTKISVALAGGDMPDGIMAPWQVSQTTQVLYGSQGLFAPINDYIEPYGENMQAMFADYPQMRDLATMPDGNIYSMPNLDDFYEGRLPHKMWIWQPWLDALNLDVPTTLDEFKDVLVAFRDDDPNGNRVADEVPLGGFVRSGMLSFGQFILNSFVDAGNDGETYTYLDNGQIKASFVEDGWRDGLRYMADLYEEGLINPEAFTLTDQTMRQINATETLIGAFSDLTPARGFVDLSATDRWKGYSPMPSLVGPGGRQVASYNPYAIGWYDGLIITTAAEYPEVLFRWGEGMYDQEITMRKYYGRIGEEIRYAQPGELGINGKPAIWASLAESGGETDTPTMHSWMHIGPHYRSSDFRSGQVVSGAIEDNPQAALYKDTIEYGTPYAQPEDTWVPPLVYTDIQASEIGDLKSPIKSYVEENMALFITGALDIETEWDDYLAEFDALDLDRFLEVIQKAYVSKYQ
jgi:putative aldouronate transport system substrate-binding protein